MQLELLLDPLQLEGWGVLDDDEVEEEGWKMQLETFVEDDGGNEGGSGGGEESWEGVEFGTTVRLGAGTGWDTVDGTICVDKGVIVFDTVDGTFCVGKGVIVFAETGKVTELAAWFDLLVISGICSSEATDDVEVRFFSCCSSAPPPSEGVEGLFSGFVSVDSTAGGRKSKSWMTLHAGVVTFVVLDGELLL